VSLPCEAAPSGCPVVALSATTGEGCDGLLALIVGQLSAKGNSRERLSAVVDIKQLPGKLQPAVPRSVRV